VFPEANRERVPWSSSFRKSPKVIFHQEKPLHRPFRLFFPQRDYLREFPKEYLIESQYLHCRAMTTRQEIASEANKVPCVFLLMSLTTGNEQDPQKSSNIHAIYHQSPLLAAQRVGNTAGEEDGRASFSAAPRVWELKTPHRTLLSLLRANLSCCIRRSLLRPTLVNVLLRRGRCMVTSPLTQQNLPSFYRTALALTACMDGAARSRNQKMMT
jgi:hypothetical protein